MKRETAVQTILTAAVLCIVCSIVVSTTAVVLRPVQKTNKVQEINKNILQVSGLWDDSLTVDENMKIFDEKVEKRIVDLSTGEYLPEMNVKSFDQKKASKDPDTSKIIDSQNDIAGIKRRENNSFVYLIKPDGDKVEEYILPIRGYGLWSTMYGFIALDSDLKTIKGITFYEHGETPGLGGEIDNPSWKEKWPGKKAFDDSGDVSIQVIKGQVDPGTENAEYKVDGLSGATITSRGVSNMLEYWLGDTGFGPFLNNIRNGEVKNG